MFGYVTASLGELTKDQRERYGGVYCGICRSIKTQASQAARLGLSYDMVFLAMLRIRCSNLFFLCLFHEHVDKQDEKYD